MRVGALLDDDERAVLRLPGVLFALALTAESLLGGLVVARMPLAHQRVPGRVEWYCIRTSLSCATPPAVGRSAGVLCGDCRAS